MVDPSTDESLGLVSLELNFNLFLFCFFSLSSYALCLFESQGAEKTNNNKENEICLSDRRFVTFQDILRQIKTQEMPVSQHGQ
jgi:hypothetical protein